MRNPLLTCLAALALGCGARTGLALEDSPGEEGPLVDTLCGPLADGPAVPIELATGVPGAAAIAVHRERVWFAQWFFGGEVLVVPRDGGTARTVASERPAVGAIAADAEGPWWVETGWTTPGGALVHASRSGRTTTVVDGLNQPGDVALAGPWVLVAEGSNAGTPRDTGIGRLWRVDRASGRRTMLLSDLGLLHAVAVDGSHVYWLDGRRGELGRVPLDGGPPETLLSELGRSTLLAARGGRVVFGGDGRLERLHVSTGDRLVLADLADERIRDLAVDATHAYWVTDGFAGDAGAFRVPLDGGPPEALAVGQERCRGIALDATRVYWTGGEVEPGYVRALCRPTP